MGERMRVAVENVSREVEPLVIARRSLVITPLYIQHNFRKIPHSCPITERALYGSSR
jgi:hypothetical protein